MRFTFNLKKRQITFFLLIALIGFTIAYGGTQPNIMGHTDGEIRLPALNQNLDAWSATVESRFTNHETRITSLENAGSSCPSGMIDGGDFCIDSDKRQSGLAQQWPTAVAVCKNAGLRLCSGVEWVAGCFSASTIQLANWGGPSGEWAGEIMGPGSGNIDLATTYGFQPVGTNYGNCYKTYAGNSINNVVPFRCCKNQ